MRRRGFTIAMVLLAAVLVLGGLTSCAKKAASRSVQGALAAEEEPAAPTSSSESAALTPQATIVSVVTTPGAEAQPPQGNVLETPTSAEPPSAEPQATPVPQPTDAPAAPPPSNTGQTVWHTVARGETLATIAQRYDTTVQAIVSANGLPNANEIYAGQRLKIPKAGSSSGSSGCRLYHTVQKGQWIYQIARTYGVTPQSILTANRLSNPDVIQPGTVLCIP